MQLPLTDSLKPYQNLKRPHTGLVVSVDDPTNRGRIKCKVEGILEASDPARLPWCFPKQSSTAGGRSDNAAFATPPLYSLVQIEFPFDDIHYPEYTGAKRVDLSNPPIAQGNATPEDGSLPAALGAGTSRGYDLMGEVWVNTGTQDVTWIRIDKNKNSIELFDQHAGAVLRLSSGGNLQFKGASFSVEVSEDIRFKVGGNLHSNVAGSTFLDTRGDTVVNSDGNIALHAGKNIDSTADQSYGITSGDKMEVTAGSEIAIIANSDFSLITGSKIALEAAGNGSFMAGGLLGLQAGSELGASAGGTFAVQAGGIASMRAGGIVALDGSLVLLEEGASATPSTLATPTNASKLGTVAAGQSALGTATGTLNQRFGALDSLVSSLAAQASATRSAGQSAISTIQTWAARLVGKTI